MRDMGNASLVGTAQQSQDIADFAASITPTQEGRRYLEDYRDTVSQDRAEKVLHSREQMAQERAALSEEYAHLPGWQRAAGSVSNMVGRMAPAMVAGAVATPLLGGAAVAAGASAAQMATLTNALSGLGSSMMVYGTSSGNAAGQALEEGASMEQARDYSQKSGVTEVLIDRLFGGIPWMGKGLVDGLGKGTVKELTGDLLQAGGKEMVLGALKQRGLDALGEGAEEVLSTIIDPALRRSTFDPDAPNASPGELAGSFAGGAGLSLLLGGAFDLASGRYSARAQGASPGDLAPLPAELIYDGPLTPALPAGDGWLPYADTLPLALPEGDLSLAGYGADLSLPLLPGGDSWRGSPWGGTLALPESGRSLTGYDPDLSPPLLLSDGRGHPGQSALALPFARSLPEGEGWLPYAGTLPLALPEGDLSFAGYDPDPTLPLLLGDGRGSPGQSALYLPFARSLPEGDTWLPYADTLPLARPEDGLSLTGYGADLSLPLLAGGDSWHGSPWGGIPSLPTGQALPAQPSLLPLLGKSFDRTADPLYNESMTGAPSPLALQAQRAAAAGALPSAAQPLEPLFYLSVDSALEGSSKQKQLIPLYESDFTQGPDGVMKFDITNAQDILRQRMSEYSDFSVITDGSHYVNGKLKPNITYQTGEHAYFYTTNSEGHIIEAYGELHLKVHDGRLYHDPNTPGKLKGDHAGHLFADRFGGSPKLDNLVSQAQKVNLSEYRILENAWAKALEEGKTVNVNIQLHYETGGSRPTSFDVAYITDNILYFKNITN